MIEVYNLTGPLKPSNDYKMVYNYNEFNFNLHFPVPNFKNEIYTFNSNCDILNISNLVYSSASASFSIVRQAGDNLINWIAIQDDEHITNFYMLSSWEKKGNTYNLNFEIDYYSTYIYPFLMFGESIGSGSIYVHFKRKHMPSFFNQITDIKDVQNMSDYLKNYVNTPVPQVTKLLQYVCDNAWQEQKLSLNPNNLSQVLSLTLNSDTSGESGKSEQGIPIANFPLQITEGQSFPIISGIAEGMWDFNFLSNTFYGQETYEITPINAVKSLVQGDKNLLQRIGQYYKLNLAQSNKGSWSTKDLFTKDTIPSNYSLVSFSPATIAQINVIGGPENDSIVVTEWDGYNLLDLTTKAFLDMIYFPFYIGSNDFMRIPNNLDWKDNRSFSWFEIDKTYNPHLVSDRPWIGSESDLTGNASIKSLSLDKNIPHIKTTYPTWVLPTSANILRLNNFTLLNNQFLQNNIWSLMNGVSNYKSDEWNDLVDIVPKSDVNYNQFGTTLKLGYDVANTNIHPMSIKSNNVLELEPTQQNKNIDNLIITNWLFENLSYIWKTFTTYISGGPADLTLLSESEVAIAGTPGLIINHIYYSLLNHNESYWDENNLQKYMLFSQPGTSPAISTFASYPMLNPFNTLWWVYPNLTRIEKSYWSYNGQRVEYDTILQLANTEPWEFDINVSYPNLSMNILAPWQTNQQNQYLGTFALSNSKVYNTDPWNDYINANKMNESIARGFSIFEGIKDIATFRPAAAAKTFEAYNQEYGAAAKYKMNRENTIRNSGGSYNLGNGGVIMNEFELLNINDTCNFINDMYNKGFLVEQDYDLSTWNTKTVFNYIELETTSETLQFALNINHLPLDNLNRTIEILNNGMTIFNKFNPFTKVPWFTPNVINMNDFFSGPFAKTMETLLAAEFWSNPYLSINDLLKIFNKFNVNLINQDK